MKIAVVGNDILRDELLAPGLLKGTELQWLVEPVEVPGSNGYIDLLFNQTTERMEALKKLPPVPIIINSVTHTLHQMPENFVRINGWPTFLKRPVAEAACLRGGPKKDAERLFHCFSKTTGWVPDSPGFVSARIVSMIINEAYFALQDKVSGKKEIDTAMKLGTHYPFGPFEWSERIGLKNICELLTVLSFRNKRYEPALLLKEEALQL